MPFKVDFSTSFTIQYDSQLDDEQRELVDDFSFHFQAHGMKGWQGKFGPTDNVPHNDNNRAHKIWFAQKHKLWHVHIGYPRWCASQNTLAPYKTSNYVVHYQRLTSDHIAIVDYGHHDPFHMPAKDVLFRRF